MAVAILNQPRFDKGLKIRYAKRLERMWLSKACALAKAVKKTYNFTGKSRTINPLYSHRSGATVFSTALANKGATVPPKQFEVTRVKEYILGSIDNETIMASQGDEGALERALDVEIDSMSQGFIRACDHQLWGDGSGVRGRILSGVGTTTVTLYDRRQTRDYEIDMYVEVSVDAGNVASPAGIRARVGDPLKVTGVDPDAGTVTFDRAVTTVHPAAANDDYLYRLGDYNSVLSGVFDWIPLTAPTVGDSHFGVDRSDFPTRLAGFRFTASGLTIEDAFFDTCARAAEHGAVIDHIFCSPAVWSQLAKSMHSKMWIQASEKYPEIGFRAISFPGPDGEVKVVMDAQLGTKSGGELMLATRLDSWELSSLGGMPHFDETGGGRAQREVAADAQEIRQKCYWNLLNLCPKDSGLVTVNL